jgi:H+/Cl- antiporter ClcA
LFLLKGTGWGISMGSFRGGPVFPAIFIGTVAGLLVQNLPGFSQGAAVPALIAATVATTLRLPFSAIVLAMVLTTSAGPPSLPLIIIAAVVAYLVSNALFARRPEAVKASAEEAPTSAEAALGPGASETGGS